MHYQQKVIYCFKENQELYGATEEGRAKKEEGLKCQKSSSRIEGTVLKKGRRCTPC